VLSGGEPDPSRERDVFAHLPAMLTVAPGSLLLICSILAPSVRPLFISRSHSRFVGAVIADHGNHLGHFASGKLAQTRDPR
jgi:hypothetical protein